MDFSNFSGEEIVATAAATAASIAKDKPNAELLVIADFFSVLSSALVTIADRREQQGIDCGSSEKVKSEK